MPPNIRALLQELYPSAQRLAILKITGEVEAFSQVFSAGFAKVCADMGPLIRLPSACSPRTDADVLDRDWHHDFHPQEYLPDAPQDVIWARFAKMVGPPLECGSIQSPEQVAAIRQRVAEHNQVQADAAAGTDAFTWLGARLVLWRGCWAVLPRQKRNKRWRSSSRLERLTAALRTVERRP